MKGIIGLFFLGLFLIFCIQNNSLVDIRFFLFRINEIPLFSVIIAIFALGILVGRVSGWFFRIMKPSEKKKQKDKKARE